MRSDHARDGGGATRDLLDDHRAGEEIEAEAPVLDRNDRAENAEIDQALEHRERLRARHDLFLDELAYGQQHLPALDGLALQRQQPADPLAVTLQELARDQRALDLVGALADDHQRRVAVVALDVERRR